MAKRRGVRKDGERGRAHAAMVARMVVLPAPACTVPQLCVAFVVVTAAQVLLKPEIETDEKVAAAHFLNLQLGFAGSAVAPCDRYRRPGIATNDGLQRKFDGEIEVR